MVQTIRPQDGVNFQLTEEQEMLQKMARDFTAKEIIPVAAEYDEKEKFPLDIFEKARQVGLVNVNIPDEYGGLGASLVDEVIIAEEIGYGCTGIGTSISANGLADLPIIIAGNDDQKAYWLGERLMDNGDIASYCVTEPAAGSNVVGMQTRAEKQGAKYILNGSKTFITNASHADFFTVFAKTDMSAGHRGISCFVVDRNSPGISISKKFEKMGQRASDTAEVTFENVEVPEDNRLGPEGSGFLTAMKVFDYSRPGVGASAVGLLRRAMEESIQYARERETFGQQIYQHQAVGHKVANMAMNYEAARLLVLQSAWTVENGTPNPQLSATAKTFAADKAMEATVDAVQIFGGYGYMREYPVEKLMRDVKVFQIYEGTSEILRNVIVRELFR
jgi:acyl-CoA dehydrogenase